MKVNAMIQTNNFFPFVKCQNSSDDFTAFLSNYENQLYDVKFDGMWKHYNFKQVKLPQSGWKGHIACLPEDIEAVFEITYNVLIAKKCTFKVARSRKVYEALSDPHTSVTEANKFITFYPEDNTKFRSILKELSIKLHQYKAPTIFTDYQLPNNSPVQFRYGAFAELKKWDQANKRFIDLMKLPNGKIVKDDRNESFNVPEGVTLPFFKADSSWIEESKNETENSNLKKYNFLGILSQKNKGDVYLAKDKERKVIIKTANPYIKNKAKNANAQQLLLNEINFLGELQSTGVVPKILDHFTVDNVTFNVTSYIDGVSLDNPTLIEHKDEIVYALCKTVYVLHKRNIIIGDLTNSNFIFSDGICYLIDLEYLSVNEKRTNREGYTPYYIPDNEGKKALSQKEDIFSLAVTILAIIFGNLPKYNSKNMDNAIKSLESEIYAGIKLKKKNINLFYIAYYLLQLAKSGNTYNPKQLKRILNRHIPKLEITPFNNQFEIDTLNYNYQNLKNRAKVYDKFGLRQKWWKSGEFGEQVSPLSLQHGIVGVDCALAKRTLKDLNTLSSILESNSKFMYSDSYLFGSSSLLWEFGYEYQNHEISYSEFETAINTIINNWTTDEKNNDFALGISGKLYSLLFVLSLNKKLINAKKTAEILYCNLKNGIERNHVSYSTTFDRINFAHGLSGTAYVLLLGALYFGDKRGIGLAKKKLTFVDHFLIKELNDSTKATNYMYLSWCEGLSGIGSALIRSQYLLKNTIHYKSLNLISSYLRNNGLRVDGCWCHGRSSVINFFSDMYLRRKDSQCFDIIKSLSLYEFATAIDLSNNDLNFIDETGYLHSLDFGVGQVGILKTMLDALHHKDRLFFLTIEQEKNLSNNFIIK